MPQKNTFTNSLFDSTKRLLVIHAIPSAQAMLMSGSQLPASIMWLKKETIEAMQGGDADAERAKVAKAR